MNESIYSYILMDPAIVDATRNNYRYVRIETTRLERILIFLKLKKKLNPVKIRSSMLMELISKLKINKKGGEKW